MKTPKHLFSAAALSAAMFAFTAHGANVLKANNNTSLDLGGSWNGGTGPAPGTTDVATWDSTVATAANCTNTLAANTNWGGIEILNPSAPVQITGGSTLFLGSSGIDLNEAGTSQSLFLNLPVNIFADQAWSVKSGQTLTFGTPTIIVTNNTVTASGNINCNNGFSVNGGGTLVVSSGNFTLVTNTVSTRPMGVGADANGGTVIQNGGNVSVSAAGGTSGSYVVSLAIGNAASATGVYDLNAGTLSDITSNKFAYCSPGNATGANGTLNISGGSATFYSLRMGNGNGNGFVNVTNGSLTVTPGEFSIGRGSTAGVGQAGTLNVYGGSVFAPGISVNLPKGIGPGILSMYGGSFGVGSSLGVPAGSTGTGTLNMYGGLLTVTNSLNLPGGGSGTGTVNLNGGTLCVGSVSATTGGACTLQLNGGILKARSNSGNFITNSSLLTVDVDSGGAIIDTTNVNVTIAAGLLNGTGGADGGLTKLGSGTLTLTGINTYNGPTTVGAGSLALTTTNTSLGTLMASNTATISTTVTAAGTTLTCASLVEGAVSGDTIGNQFNLGTGNPTAPLITTTSLTANGTVNVSVNGSGLSIGTIPLIQYSGSVAGSGSFVLQFLAGASGFVTNNTTTHSINLVITGFPNLTWRAQVNTNWDLVTANWVDTNNNQVVYVNGATINFNDTANNTLVYLTNNFSPATVNIANVKSNYLFTGTGTIGGAGGITKTGAGLVVMALTNTYSGNTVISNGTFQLGGRNVIPSGSSAGNVVVEGKLDLAGFNQSLNGLNGNNGVIDNSGGTAATLSVGNNAGTGTFAGEITNSGSSLTLNNVGGSLTLLSANGYSGGTTNGGGILQLASPQSIGSGPLTLNGGTLEWANTSAQILTNPLTIGGSVTLGAVSNGPTAVAGTVNLNNGGRGITCNSGVLFAAGLTNGTVTTKSGLGTLILTNTSGDWNGGAVQIAGGQMVFTGNGNVIVDGNNLRVQCNLTNGFSELTITNGASLVMSNSPGANLRVGASDTTGAPGCTNILDVAGLVDIIAYPGGSDKLMMGGSSGTTRDAEDVVNLYPGGTLVTSQVTNTLSTSSSPPTVFNFNGGTLVAATNAFASDFFDAGIYPLNVYDGGAVIDTAGFTGIMFNNDLQAAGNGTGSLTKNGAGQLILAGSGFGTSSYGGATIVNGGTLTVLVPLPNTTNFTIAAGAVLDISSSPVSLTTGESITGGGGVVGSVSVGSGALIAPGTTTSAGTLTFSNTAPSLGGAALLKLDKGSAQANDQIAVASGGLSYGGTLTVTNIGATPTSGDKFYLFSAASYSGSFSSVKLPTLPVGLGWTNNFLMDGSITVTGAVTVPSIPRFNSVMLNNNKLIMGGTNGTALTNYRVWSTTNLTIPLPNWTPIATNAFNSSGNFSFTNTINPAKPIQFFEISVP
jgi:fibronectin-binding autotransporter adhesin